MRLLQMFGRTVLGIGPELFEDALSRHRADRGVASDTGLDAHDLAVLADEFKTLIREATGEEFPQDPVEQLYQAIRAVFRSWNGERARLYRRREHISDDLGTAVNIQVRGDPDSIHFFHDAGLDYVSCSPFRVPVARLEAGRAAIDGRSA